MFIFTGYSLLYLFFADFFRKNSLSFSFNSFILIGYMTLTLRNNISFLDLINNILMVETIDLLEITFYLQLKIKIVVQKQFFVFAWF